MRSAIEDTKVKKASFEAKGGVSDKDSIVGLEAPLWQPDSSADCCYLCEQQFTLTRRRVSSIY